MKTFIISFAFLFIACASTQSVQPIKLQPQEIIVTVKSHDNPVDVNVQEKSDNINRSMDIPNEDGRLSMLSFIAGNKAFLKIFSGISVSDVTNIWNDFCVLESKTQIRDVNLFINSPGGDAFSGMALADEIERAKKKGFIVTAHASGIIASAAVPVFAVCDVRLAAPGTIFMVHEASLWKWPGQETASDIRSQNELMDLLRDRYMGKLVANSKLAKEEWERLEKKTTWFSTEKALEWGLVDRIE